MLLIHDMIMRHIWIFHMTNMSVIYKAGYVSFISPSGTSNIRIMQPYCQKAG